MSTLSELIAQIKAQSTPERAEQSKYFTKTGPDQYGAGDVFCGLNATQMRQLSAEYGTLSLEEVEILLADKVHELRVIGLLILVLQYQKTKDDVIRKKIYDFYIQHRAAANNWDLVDLSATKLVGEYLIRFPKERTILYQFIKSDNLWERRIAMVSTLAFIRKGDYNDTLQLTALILNEKEDLMHKAGGWMLRELGKRDENRLCAFLDLYVGKIPRTMLRYAIERFPEPKRLEYLKAKNIRENETGSLKK